MNFRFGYLVMPIGGALVGLVLYEPRAGDFAYVAGAGRLDVLLFSDVTAAALAAVIAVLVAACAVRGTSAVCAVIAGSASILVPLLFPSSVALFINGIGAGLERVS